MSFKGQQLLEKQIPFIRIKSTDSAFNL